MAQSRYALVNAGENASPDLNAAAMGAGTTALAADQNGGLRQALLVASDKIGLLTTSIDALSVTLSNLRSLAQAASASAKNGSSGGQKTPAAAAGGTELPESRKSAIAMDSAVAALREVTGFSLDKGKEMAQSSLITASAALVAAGGTTAVELVNVESLAAKAGIGSQLPDEDRKTALLTFATDAAITASAFKVSAMEAAEMMKVWRTSMKLTQDQSRDLADAVNHLGKMPGDVQAADIGAVLQQSGESALDAGLQPEQAAALAAALLNSGTKKDDAGAALKNIAEALGKGAQTNTLEKGAWAQLGLDPKVVAAGMQDPATTQGTLLSVLAALNNKPAEQRATLSRTLFAESAEAAQSLSKNLQQVNEAYGQISKGPGATDYKGSVNQSALDLSVTQQGQLNIKNAREERLSVAKGNALAPAVETPGKSGWVTNTLSEFAEDHPGITDAALTTSAFIKPVFDWALDAVLGEVKDRFGKGAVDKVISKFPKSAGLSAPAGAAANSLAESQGAALAGRTASAASGLKILEQTAWPNAPRVAPLVATARPLAAPMPWPVKAAIAGTVVAESIEKGDAKGVGTGLTTLGMGLSGAALGTWVGTAIGTVGLAPGMAIGGALGGLIGGWLGSEAGGALGEKLFAPAPDKLAAPEQVSKDLMTTQQVSQAMTYSPTVQVYCSDPGSSENIGLLVNQHLQNQFAQQFSPLMNTNPLGTRRDAALTDGVAT